MYEDTKRLSFFNALKFSANQILQDLENRGEGNDN